MNFDFAPFCGTDGKNLFRWVNGKFVTFQMTKVGLVSFLSNVKASRAHANVYTFDLGSQVHFNIITDVLAKQYGNIPHNERTVDLNTLPMSMTFVCDQCKSVIDDMAGKWR
jgi:hypothetical protein